MSCPKASNPGVAESMMDENSTLLRRLTMASEPGFVLFL